jgi:hypothetical protein
MPEDNAPASDDFSKLTRATPISSELDGKLKAVSGYDEMFGAVVGPYG